jgi:hypothetical protein
VAVLVTTRPTVWGQNPPRSHERSHNEYTKEKRPDTTPASMRTGTLNLLTRPAVESLHTVNHNIASNNKNRVAYPRLLACHQMWVQRWGHGLSPAPRWKEMDQPRNTRITRKWHKMNLLFILVWFPCFVVKNPVIRYPGNPLWSAPLTFEETWPPLPSACGLEVFRKSGGCRCVRSHSRC